MSTTPMTDREAHIRGICEVLGDDVRRLVFADWLEEQEAEEDRNHAEFIRVQIAIANGEAGLRKRAEELWRKLEGKRFGPNGIPDGMKPFSTELFPGDFRTFGFYARGFLSEICTPLSMFVGRVCTAIGPHHGDRCDRGRIQSPNAQFTQDCIACQGTGRVGGIARHAFDHFPIEKVVLTDCRPATGGVTRGLMRFWTDSHVEMPGETQGGFWLPPELFRCLGPECYHSTSYRTNWIRFEDAADILSRACVRHGRHIAGLPPIATTTEDKPA